ncbi:condensation domain-containing protein [Streptomyces sp. NRRL S-350]|uniref:condensation domain-containing protein n=1 Tax=Streptomyces sp. NRRL S-350 TaxID=1463902 RepID=UPI0004BED05E|nr:condensation domain-containing protein [Streptomyces sp. NRRL S-350]
MSASPFQSGQPAAHATLPPDRPRPPVPQFRRATVGVDGAAFAEGIAEVAARYGVEAQTVAVAAVAAALAGRHRRGRTTLAVGPASGPARLLDVEVDLGGRAAAAVALGRLDAELETALDDALATGPAAGSAAAPGNGRGAGQAPAGRSGVAVLFGRPAEQWRDIEPRLADRDLVLSLDPDRKEAGCEFDRDLYDPAGVTAFCEDVRQVLAALLDSPDLPVLDVEESAAPDAAPAAPAAPGAPEPTAAEDLLAGIWAEVLDVSRAEIEAGSDFFALGGHSLLAARVAMRVGTVFGVELAVEDLFHHPTLSGLADRIDRAAPTTVRPIPAAPAGGAHPLSSAQTGIWLAEQLNPGAAQYNFPLYWRLRGTVDPGALRRALDGLVRRHEALRLRITESDAGPVQTVAPVAAAAFETVELPGADEAALAALVERTVNAPFDLAANALRAVLVRLGADDWAFVLVVHHIVCDQWSLAHLVDELGTLYAGGATASDDGPDDGPRTGYLDYAAWHRGLLAERLPALQEHWRESVVSAPEVDLAALQRSDAGPGLRSGCHRFEIPAGLLGEVEALGRRSGTTPFMVLYAAFLGLLHRYSGRLDLTVGTSVAGRSHPQLEALVGSFVNLVQLRTGLAAGLSFGEVLERARTTVIDAYTHQDYPLETALRERRLHGAQGSPLTSVIFELLNVDPVRLVLPGAAAEEVPVRVRSAKFGLMVTLEATASGTIGNVEYQADRYDAGRIARFVEDYLSLLAAVVRDPQLRAEQWLPAGAPAAPGPTAVAGAGAGAGVDRAGVEQAGVDRADVAGAAGDHGAVRRPEQPDAGPAPASRRREALEIVLADIWADEIGVDAVAADQDFFTLGGYSLTATRIVARLRRELSVTVPLRLLLVDGTVAALAAYIEEHEPDLPGLHRTVRVIRLARADEHRQRQTADQERS